DLARAGVELTLIGFSDEELEALLDDGGEPDQDVAEEIPDPPATPVTQSGDVWQIGRHRLICGDCRDLAVVGKLLAGARAAVAITSPPYATQREYDPTSGVKPVPPEEYVEWYRAVAAGIESVLAPDGSYFLNIKAHADDGERNLYVMDLVLAHQRVWGWRFVDEFCWRKTDNGVPGGWQNRFKNAWEPIFHFCRQQQIKFRADAVSHASDDCFDYSPDNPTSRSGSGLLGTGPRGAAASSPPQGSQGWGHMRRKLMDGRHEGLARPSNVIEATTESTQGSHSAPFPRALPEFFIKAFSDAGDIIFDCFMGSGTTIADENAILWLWTTNAHLPVAFDVVEAWGFEYKALLTWVKDRMGTGEWLRGQTEHCMLAARGKPVFLHENHSTVLEAARREHSRKPEEFYALVEATCPGGKVELFCRQHRNGWHVYGNDTNKFGNEES